jgi:hypothetical protein
LLHQFAPDDELMKTHSSLLEIFINNLIQVKKKGAVVDEIQDLQLRLMGRVLLQYPKVYHRPVSFSPRLQHVGTGILIMKGIMN